LQNTVCNKNWLKSLTPCQRLDVCGPRGSALAAFVGLT